MKEAKAGKESIASKANYLSNRQTFICGGMKGVLTLLIAFVLFGFSSCKPRESKPASVGVTGDPSITSSSASSSPVTPPPESQRTYTSPVSKQTSTSPASGDEDTEEEEEEEEEEEKK
jgi:hypothetical protein